MRKFFILIAIVFFLSGANIAYSASGACSYHGGVNCSAGSDWDGSVICNDGWQDSSVSYSSMVSCQQSQSSVSSYSCRTEADYQALYTQLVRMGSLRYAGASSQGILDECRRSITEYQSEQLNYQNSISNQKTQTETYYSQLQELILQRQEILKKQQRDAETKNKELLNTSCQNSIGIFSHYDSDRKKCVCSDGFTLYNGKCEDPDVMCKEKLGVNSHPSASYVPSLYTTQYDCYCNTGYELNSSDVCQVIPKPVMKITQKVKEWADNIKSPCESNGLGFSQEEIAQCKMYQLHPNDYNWVIVKPSIPTSNTSVVNQITPKQETTLQKPKAPVSTQPTPQQKIQKQVISNEQISATTTTDKTNVSNAKTEEVKQQKEAPPKTSASGKIKRFLTKLKFW